MRQLKGKSLKRFIKDIPHPKKEIILILDNVEYARNVASVFRIADALHCKKVVLTGITKSPPFGKDLAKVSRHKERTVPWEYIEDSVKALKKYSKYQQIAIEITDTAVPYKEFQYADKVCFIIGNEGYGISQKVLDNLHDAVYIPIAGKGRSINVHIALAVVAFYISN